MTQSVANPDRATWEKNGKFSSENFQKDMSSLHDSALALKKAVEKAMASLGELIALLTELDIEDDRW